MIKKHHFLGALLLALFVTNLAGCAETTQKVQPKETEIITQKPSSPDKTKITVLVKNAFAIRTFEKTVEEKFPQIDLIQVGNYSSDMGIDAYASRLEHDDLTDIVMTWPLDVGEEYWSERLMDLSALPMTSGYTTAMLNNIIKDGKLYYLPGPSQVRGIVYNKTLFQENGWEVPKDFEGFVSLCQDIEKTGIRSLQLGLGNEEVLDTAFVGYGYEDSFAKPENAQRMKDYNSGKGSFGDNFAPALATFQTLIDKGILQKNDLQLHYQDREEMLFTRRCAMVEDSVLMARMGMERNGCTDEFGLMPFFNPNSKEGDWVRLYPVCYIGVNKNLGEKKNKDKYDLVMQLLEYISTAEGQLALAGDTDTMFSALKGVVPPDIPESKDLIPALTHGRYAIFPTLKNAQGALRTGLAGMVAGTMTAADVIAMVDQQNSSPSSKEMPEVLGSAEKDFSLIETGNFVTDTMRSKSDCDIALFLDNGKDGRTNGKGLNARLYQGDLTAVDIQCILPDLRDGEKGELWKTTMTGEDLIKTLEYSIPVNHEQTGWFYYFSGLKMTYNPTAEPGKRIHEIEDSNGKKIEPQKIYSVAVMDDTVPEEFLKSCEKTGILIKDLLQEKIKKEKTITPSEDGRFTIES